MLVALTAMPLTAHSASSRVVETTLPDGLKVLTMESHAAPVVCTYVFYRVGSRNETPGITGVSHQLEHMLFKGTRKLFPTPGYIDRLIGRHGGVNNAETTADYTDYYLLIPTGQLDLALRIEADRMTQAAIDPAQLTAEKRVVLSELEGGENQNSEYLYDNMRATAFQLHPYHYPVIGSKWDVKHFTREQVYDYYASHYCPNNATLVVVGDFKTSELIARIRELWKDVKSHPVPTVSIAPEPKQHGERKIVVRRAGTTSYVDVGYHIPAAGDPDLPALDVLATLLSSGRSSFLYRALVEKELAASVAAGANESVDPDLFELAITASAGVDPSKIEEPLFRAIDNLKQYPLDPHELQKAKNLTRAAFVFASEGVQAQAQRLGVFQTETGSWSNMDAYLQHVYAVSAADIMRVTQKYLIADNRTVATFYPNGEKASPDADSTGGAHSAHYRSNGRPGTFPSLVTTGYGSQSVRQSSPHVVSKTLKNGVHLLVEENHTNATVTIHGFVRTGSIDDPSGSYGEANLVAGLLSRGAGGHSSQQIAESLDFVGANLSFAALRERIDLNAAMLSDNFEEITTILADCLKRPSFPGTELEKLRSETITALHEIENDTGMRANRRLYEKLFAANPQYGHDPTGTIASIGSITVEGIRAFYEQHIRPENTTLVVVGDISATDAIRTLTERLEDWKQPEQAIPAALVRQSMESAERAQVDSSTEAIVMVDKTQDDIAMGIRTISRTDHDYAPLQLMNLILGADEFVGRVGKRVRDTEGLAYYAYTALAPGQSTGVWSFRAGVNPANVLRAIASARDEVAKMAAKGATPAELDWARDNTIGSMLLILETSGGIAEQLANAEFYHLGSDYLVRYPDIVRRITLREVNAVATKYLRLPYMTTVIAGPTVLGLSSK